MIRVSACLLEISDQLTVCFGVFLLEIERIDTLDTLILLPSGFELKRLKGKLLYLGR